MTETGKGILNGHTAAVQGVAVHPQGKRAVSVGLDRTVRVWNLDTGKELFQAQSQGDDYLVAAYSPDGRRFAIAGKDGTVPDRRRLERRARAQAGRA